MLAPFILKYVPAHRRYLEPYGGAASVLLRKNPSFVEYFNDLDSSICTLFRVLRDPEKAARLIELLRLTPFARDEFNASYELTDDPVEASRRLIVMSFMGWGSNAHARRATAFRSNSNRSGTTPAHDWANYPDALALVVDRFKDVIVENRDALGLIEKFNTPDTLIYLDPPYVWSTRSQISPHDAKYRRYSHDMDDRQHRKLLTLIKSRRMKAMILLSGYPCDLYDDRLKNWRRVEYQALADGAKPRTEVLWINPAAARKLDAEAAAEAAKRAAADRQLRMFDAPAV